MDWFGEHDLVCLLHFFARPDHVLFNAVHNNLCVALKKIYDSIEFVTEHPLYIGTLS